MVTSSLWLPPVAVPDQRVVGHHSRSWGYSEICIIVALDPSRVNATDHVGAMGVGVAVLAALKLVHQYPQFPAPKD